jgi:hypothetical protein
LVPTRTSFDLDADEIGFFERNVFLIMNRDFRFNFEKQIQTVGIRFEIYE